MSTCRKTWQNAEAELAELFGCKRRPLSGSSGRTDLDCSDSTHPTLYLEAKLRAAHPIWTLRDSCKKKAKGKPIVLGIKRKGSPGMMICVHTDDLLAMVDAWGVADATG